MRGDFTTEFNRYLNSNEKVIWSGKPKSGLIFRKSNLYQFVFGLCWLGFTVFWLQLAQEESEEMAMVGIPMAIVGVYLAFGKFFTDALIRSNTHYAITQERIIVKYGIFNKTLNAYHIRSMTDLKHTEKADGSGSITFGTSEEFTPLHESPGGGVQFNFFSHKKQPGLDLIQDVRKVYGFITQAQKE